MARRMTRLTRLLTTKHLSSTSLLAHGDRKFLRKSKNCASLTPQSQSHISVIAIINSLQLVSDRHALYSARRPLPRASFSLKKLALSLNPQ